MNEPIKYISVTVETFEYRPDERGYMSQYNKVKVLESCCVDTPEERAKAAHLANTVLVPARPWPRDILNP